MPASRTSPLGQAWPPTVTTYWREPSSLASQRYPALNRNNTMDEFSTDDFLARERAALGNDAGLFSSNDVPTSGSFDLPTTDFPDLGDGTSTPPPLPEPTSSSLAPGFPSLDSLTPQKTGFDVNITGAHEDEEMEKFQNEFPDVQELLPAELQPAPVVGQNYQYGDSPYSASIPQPAGSLSVPGNAQQSSTPTEDVESEALIAWKAKQQEDIKRRDEASRKKREETVLKAEKAIDQFYEEYNASKEKAIKENKENEAAFLADLSDRLSQGTTWERITDMIALENSQSKTLAKSTPGGSDLARMKEVLLKLRRQGESAPGAKGY
ncbi:Vesicle coat protein clathrin, light chain [Phaffia rhodozyma]|uniref:Clathrin light chain n=1 Tax=Phaffia rhodozyma TaxID=264483 RepID=A0A0F7SLQ8_PHARH|nr:Vesicle coat protein clathrin, light chain [Phaffia rhodozyma]